MLGSPNYFRGVYNGTGADASVVNGSSYLQGLFEAHFQSLSLPTTPTAFNGRSDYGPFIENGIPAVRQKALKNTQATHSGVLSCRAVWRQVPK